MPFTFGPNLEAPIRKNANLNAPSVNSFVELLASLMVKATAISKICEAVSSIVVIDAELVYDLSTIRSTMTLLQVFIFALLKAVAAES